MSDKQSSELKTEITKYTTQPDAFAKLERGETVTVSMPEKGEAVLSLVNGRLSVTPVARPNLENASPDSPVFKEKLQKVLKGISKQPEQPGGSGNKLK